MQHPLERLEQGARLIRRRLVSGPVALLFGSEKVGLSNQDLSHCHWLLRIPTRAEHASMNLGQAVAVCLYELARQPRAAPKAKKLNPSKPKSSLLGAPELPTAGEVERITTLLLDVLRDSGFLDPRPSLAAQDKLRRLVRRLRIPARDSEAWLGMLRQIHWKIRSEKQEAGER